MPLLRRSGGGQLPIITPIPQAIAGNAVPAANTAYLLRFRVAATIPVATVTYYVAAASGNVDGGVYSWDGTTLTRLASSGSTAASGSSTTQDLALSATVPLAPGVDYYLALAADNATITIGRNSLVGGISGFGSLVLNKASSFPLPSTITGYSVGGSYQPWIGAK